MNDTANKCITLGMRNNIIDLLLRYDSNKILNLFTILLLFNSKNNGIKIGNHLVSDHLIDLIINKFGEKSLSIH